MFHNYTREYYLKIVRYIIFSYFAYKPVKFFNELYILSQTNVFNKKIIKWLKKHSALRWWWMHKILQSIEIGYGIHIDEKNLLPLNGNLFIFDDELIVSFGGTSTMYELYYQSVHSKLVHCETHFGHIFSQSKIRKCYLELFDFMIGRIVPFIHTLSSERKITFTGHSKGSVIAVLFGMYYHYILKISVDVFGYGCPKFSNKDFNSHIPDHFHLITLSKDIISSVPLTGSSCSTIVFSKNKVYHQKKLILPSISEHSIHNYLEKILLFYSK